MPSSASTSSAPSSVARCPRAAGQLPPLRLHPGARHAALHRRPLSAGQEPDRHVRPVEAASLRALLAYDGAYLPADRPRFLESWLAAPGHRALARIVDGTLTGYGVRGTASCGRAGTPCAPGRSSRTRAPTPRRCWTR
ncbi:hypothetical protein [Streptomyces huasconensis]|uniref:hypothetical protein n=1 Tax=Streptomyces huasconensis TaxID=1854574 RepID=UPI0033C92941